MFKKSIVEITNTKEKPPANLNVIRIMGLLFADELAIAYFTSYGLQKKIEVIHKHCKKNCNLTCNFNEYKIKILRKGEN